MKLNRNFIFIPLLSVGLLAGCAKIKKSDAEYEREQWIEGFSDSIGYYTEKQGHIENELNEINNKIGTMLDKFEHVQNPREVTGYFILKGWQSKLPFTKTAIYARINEREQLELIATRAGGTFNQIGVADGDELLSSEVVPNDQAFNYRHSGYNTVYFSGGKADTIAEYIASHRHDKINLEYIEGNKKNNFLIPQDEKDMISTTWELYKMKSDASEMQKELWISSKKIETFRRIMDNEQQKEQ